MLALPACGGGSSNELVRIHSQDTLDFRMDSSDGPDHVFQVDGTWIVTRDGTATETVTEPGPGRSKTVELSALRLKRIKQLLAVLDLDALQHHFGTDKEGDGTAVITYGGQTVTLDSQIMGFAPVDEAPGVARPFARLMRMLANLLEAPRSAGGHANGAEVATAPSNRIRRVLHRQTQQMRHAIRRRSCDDTRKLVARADLNQRQAREIYTQVRDQPCP